MSRAIRVTSLIPAPIEEVWKAWTTEKGAKAFFAPDCRIDLQVGGAYEMYFDLEAKPGERGGEGVTILALDPPHMLSLTWNAPPEMLEIRAQKTHVTICLESTSARVTKIALQHDGWGRTVDWQKARRYFSRAWRKVVIPRLIKSFTDGPIHWDI